MNILHVDSSILGANSASRQLSATVVAALTAADAAAKVAYRDLAAQPIPHLSAESFAGMMGGAGGAHEPSLAHDLATGETVLEEFMAADTVVIGAPVYNFSVPSQLKSWLDRLFMPGKTFRYTEKGPEGLAGDKRVILAVTRGGVYGPGSPAASLEHGETYLRGVFAFLSVTRLDVIVAEGLRIGDVERAAAMAGAQERIAELA